MNNRSTADPFRPVLHAVGEMDKALVQSVFAQPNAIRDLCAHVFMCVCNVCVRARACVPACFSDLNILAACRAAIACAI